MTYRLNHDYENNFLNQLSTALSSLSILFCFGIIGLVIMIFSFQKKSQFSRANGSLISQTAGFVMKSIFLMLATLAVILENIALHDSLSYPLRPSFLDSGEYSHARYIDLN